jgi:hypothetical protein
MDKLVTELLSLLREMLESQQRLLTIAMARQDAMRAFDVERLNALTDQEKGETDRAGDLDRKRKDVTSRLRNELGRNVPPTVTEVAKRVNEPVRSQLLATAAELKAVVEKVDRHTRINAKVSDAVVKGMARVLKVVTGMAQHAGLYMRNGRKAAVAGIHLLEVTA